MRSRSTSSAGIPNSIPRPTRWFACRPGGCASCLPNIMRRKAGSDPIRLVIPRGSYVPAYEEMPADRPAQDRADAAQIRLCPTQSAGKLIRSASDKPPSPKPGVGIGQVRLLWGALALVAVLLVAGRLSHQLPAVPHAGDHRSRRAGSADADRGHPRAVAVEALPTIRVRGRKQRSGDAARRCRVQGGVLRLRYAGPDRQRFCRSATRLARSHELCADGGARRRAGRRPPRAEEPGQRQGLLQPRPAGFRRPDPDAVADVVAKRRERTSRRSAA